MTLLRLAAGLILALTLSACGTMDTATRNAPLDLPAFEGGPEPTVVNRDYDVQGMTFFASDALTVSERNSYYPFADIVWRGDPVGDRKAQIGGMFRTAIDRNEAALDGAIPVTLDIALVRFHGVTERTRFSVGGNYHIVFDITVRDAVTGLIIEEPRRIELNLAAPGGEAAVIAESRGQTEKVRVTDFLTQVLKDEMSGEHLV